MGRCEAKMPGRPEASVIVAAYNRPYVVRFALMSALQSSVTDIEVIVVGDGCNAETEQAVREVSDGRVTFVNLPENSGHQSTPHNEGLKLARGRYVFFLNQDDMYFPDHIERRLAFLEESKADISWGPIILLQKSAGETVRPVPQRDRIILDGVSPHGHYDPRTFIISSSWGVRREIAESVGPWVQPRDTHLSPSQEWLFRAARKGCRLEYHPHPSVFCIHSGVRRYSYLSPESPEHDRAWNWVSGSKDNRIELLSFLASQLATDLAALNAAAGGRNRPVMSRVERVLDRLGVHPDAFQRWRSGLEKGGWVKAHTAFTSMAPMISLNEEVSMAMGYAGAFLGKGWHDPEREGRWTSGRRAEIFFTLPEELAKSGDLRLAFRGHPLEPGAEVTFRASSGSALTKKIGGRDELVLLPVTGSGGLSVSIAVNSAKTPRELGINEDPRVLGYWLSSVKLIKDGGQ